MERRLLSLLACCSVSAACFLATAPAGRADEPGLPFTGVYGRMGPGYRWRCDAPMGLPGAPMVVVAPNDAPTAATVLRVGAPAAEGTAPGIVAPPAVGPAPAMLGDPGSCACNPCTQACCAQPCSRFYVTGEYLLWWFKDSPQPVPLVTAIPPGLVPPGGTDPFGVRAGSLADPTASVILGGQDIDTGLRSGARFTVGGWLDDHQCLGFEGSYFFIAPTTKAQFVGADGSANSALLSVPFFDVTGQFMQGPPPPTPINTTPNGLPGPGARPILSPSIGAFVFTRDFPAAIPGETAAAFVQRLESRMQGFELNSLFGLSSRGTGNGLRLEGLGGFRYLNLRESLGFSTFTSAAPLGSDDFLATEDQFTTRNDFYGGQIGLRGEYRRNRLVMRAAAKVALGDVREQVTIAGSTASNIIPNTINGALGFSPTGAAPLFYAGGVFAQPSNIGTFSRDSFAVVPEVDINVGYQVFDWARVFVGYSFLYLSNVARPGNEINPAINVSRIPFNTDPALTFAIPGGPVEPALHFSDSSFWAQGINFGLEIRY